MNTAQPFVPTTQRPLRLWPGVVAVTLQWLLRFFIPLLVPEALIYGVIGEFVFALIIVIWWAFFSRAPWTERLAGLALMPVAMLAFWKFLDRSITNGMMGMMFLLYAIPSLCLALVVWAAASRYLAPKFRLAWMAAAIGLACAFWTLVRTDGVSGDGGSQFAWRWSKTAEQRLLAQAVNKPTAPGAIPVSLATATLPEPSASLPATPPAPAGEPTPAPARVRLPKPAATPPTAPAITESVAAWPGFRGSHRDSIVSTVRIDTDWAAKPPVKIWQQPIGPGWSSFAIGGDVFYTQEQRGDSELVACYALATGKPVWTHRDNARFWESNGGAGPRGTPTLSNGRVYTFGATGIVNALKASDGTVLWSRNAGSDAEVKIPGWGFASSPLVWKDSLIVAASGRLIAYDLATGHPRWLGPRHVGGYSSPHLATIDGVPQILLVGGAGVMSVAPADGKLLWEDAWDSGSAIIQPAITPDGDVLFSNVDMGGGVGIRRLALAQNAGAWKVEERWTSKGLKPYFNDFVIHNGHVFGFDSSILACIDLKDGTRKWKGGRYGHGQILLLPEQDVLLVLSEEGELALVGAGTDQFKELARMPAIEGKTWNHPALAGDVLLVRNGQEMAAFRLKLAHP